MRKNFALSLIVASISAFGCSGGSKSPDEAVSGTISDTELMREAEAAANNIIRNADNCELVRESFTESMDKLDEVEAKLQTEAGRTTLGSLRKQVGTISEACGLR